MEVTIEQEQRAVTKAGLKPFGLALFFSLLVIEGFVFMKALNWHMAPLFGLPLLSFGKAFFFNALIGWVCQQPRKPGTSEEDIETFCYLMLSAGMLLLISWVLKVMGV